MDKKVCYRDELIGLIGNPVDENPTVVVMDAAFKKLGIPYRYNTTLVYPEDLKTAVEGIRAYNMKGSHVTVPYKVACIPYLDELSESAKLIGAVNTIVHKDRKLYGENTDGKGFVQAMDDNNVKIEGSDIVVLGAGGAARALCVELALRGIRHITVVNRSVERGMELVNHLKANFPSLSVDFCPWTGTYKVPDSTDILINCTNIGLYPDTNVPDVDFDSIDSSVTVCDIIPNPLKTTFIEKAAARGCKTLTGFNMLVNQAAMSFQMWTGLEAPIDVMREALLSTM